MFLKTSLLGTLKSYKRYIYKGKRLTVALYTLIPNDPTDLHLHLEHVWYIHLYGLVLEQVKRLNVKSNVTEITTKTKCYNWIGSCGKLSPNESHKIMGLKRSKGITLTWLPKQQVRNS